MIALSIIFGNYFIFGKYVPISLDMRKFIAYGTGGCDVAFQFTASDVESLVADDAVATRISNYAASVTGSMEPGAECIGSRCDSWEEFVEKLRQQQ